MNHKLSPAFREFLLTLDFVLKWEGGTSNHPSDWGGFTSRGITQRSYDQFATKFSRKPKSVDELTDIDVVDFYWFDRFIPSQAHLFPYPLNLVMFDNAVLFSVPASLSFVNEYIYADPEDYSSKGVELLLTRLKGGLPPHEVALGICEYREKEHRRVVKRNPSQAVFLDGWLNRLGELRNVIKEYTQRKEPLWRYKTQTSQPS